MICPVFDFSVSFLKLFVLPNKKFFLTRKVVSLSLKMAASDKDVATVTAELEDAKTLLQIARTAGVQSLLEKKVAELSATLRSLQPAEEAAAPSSSSSTAAPTPTETVISSFSWDESKAFVKVYVNNLEGIKEDMIKVLNWLCLIFLPGLDMYWPLD